MQHRIEQMESFNIVGYKKRTTNENMQGMQDGPAFWGEVLQNNRQLQILPLMNTTPMGLLGVCVYNVDATDPQVFDYYIACATTQPAPEGMETHTVPAATWAVFPCTRQSMLEVQTKIITDWMPQSGYTAVNKGYETGLMDAPAPDIELYGQDENVEIWVAVTKA